MTDDQNPNATWWCWTENEPSTFHCRERGHDVRPLTPGTPVGVSERAARQPTSARLRETQAALAASQQDLTRARGQVVDLLYIIDAFQIESGADRNASYATGIEAVRKLRQDLAAARHQNRILTAENEAALRRLNEVTP